jgi:uncharacterized protein YggE
MSKKIIFLLCVGMLINLISATFTAGTIKKKKSHEGEDEPEKPDRDESHSKEGCDGKLCCRAVPTITSTGSAQISVPADEIKIDFEIKVRKPKAQQALDAVTEISTKVTGAILGLGINSEDIETTGFDLGPVYITVKDPKTGQDKTVLDGWEATHRLEVTLTDFSLIGDVIDKAVAAGTISGVTYVSVTSVSMEVSEEKQSSFTSDLIKKAVANAKSKASTALKKLGYVICGVQSVTLGYSAPVSLGKSAELSRSIIFPGSGTITQSVDIVFTIKKKKSSKKKDD